MKITHFDQITKHVIYRSNLNMYWTSITLVECFRPRPHLDLPLSLLAPILQLQVYCTCPPAIGMTWFPHARRAGLLIPTQCTQVSGSSISPYCDRKWARSAKHNILLTKDIYLCINSTFQLGQANLYLISNSNAGAKITLCMCYFNVECLMYSCIWAPPHLMMR